MYIYWQCLCGKTEIVFFFVDLFAPARHTLDMGGAIKLLSTLACAEIGAFA